MLNLSVLDFGMINPPGYPSENAILDVFELVTRAEDLGYKRYWLAEHFTNDCAWAFPEVILPLMAGYTSKIKIGLAGVLLNYHNPFQIASNFKLLSFLYPGRIDLGIARGGISLDIQKALKINHIADSTYIDKQMSELYNCIFNQQGLDNSYASINIPPYSSPLPDIWQLCSSVGQGIDFAVKYRSNLCVSMIHQYSNKWKVGEAITTFRRFINESDHLKKECIVALNVLCINDENILLRKKYEIEKNTFITNLIIGNSEFVKGQILELQYEFNVDEFAIYIPCWEYSLRLETLTNLGEMFLHQEKNVTCSTPLVI